MGFTFTQGSNLSDLGKSTNPHSLPEVLKLKEDKMVNGIQWKIGEGKFPLPLNRPKKMHFYHEIF